jgi:hypothetical protein
LEAHIHDLLAWMPGRAGAPAARSPAARARRRPARRQCTRLASLVNTIDPKIVAAAFGMNPEGVTFYLADHVDTARLPAGP